MRESEGFVEFRGHRTWWRRVDPDARTEKLPLLVLHGGPGSASASLSVLEELTAHGYPVVRYDQLGCGNSDRPDAVDLWHAETFYDEIDVVRAHLGLSRIHLLGHSWGGMLAMVHASRRPDVLGLVLSSAPASVPRIARETREMVARLPEDVRRVIEEHEARGSTDSHEYEAAVHEFNRRHICRLDPYPAVLSDRAAHGAQVYATMCGPSEFSIVGRLKDWDFMDQLVTIAQPTLLTGGRFDEYTPGHALEMLDRLRTARYVCFGGSAHTPYLEEPDAYRATVAGFLDEVERSRSEVAVA
jgi:proline-specific peptidase